MSVRVAINGFGRIGRSVFRIMSEEKETEVVAVNDIGVKKALAYLLKYDTIMGTFGGRISADEDHLYYDDRRIRMLATPDLAQLPWEDLGIDIVIEATGRFRKAAEIARHLEAGAGKVILTVPAKDEIDATIVIGVNDQELRPEHRIISNASCTTNCLAPIAKILNDSIGIVKGFMTTVHAYTNDQRLADVPHTDLRRSRAAAENIIPTTTGAARAVGKVLPELEGKLDGIAMRVPVPDGSIVDLVTEISRDVTVEEVNEIVKSAATSRRYRNIVEYCEDPIVSTDIIQNPHSGIFDSLATHAVGGNYLKTVTWYDNEWGYANRVVDLVGMIAALES
jgi:glyceraldehyde 3-phosphate dehydrogenase